jgi:hypothetical protein
MTKPRMMDATRFSQFSTFTPKTVVSWIPTFSVNWLTNSVIIPGVTVGAGVADGSKKFTFWSSLSAAGMAVGGSGVSVSVTVGVKLGLETMVGVDVLQAIKNANKSIVPDVWNINLYFGNLVRMISLMLIISNLIFTSIYS